jgi:hypothetical protein
MDQFGGLDERWLVFAVHQEVPDQRFGADKHRVEMAGLDRRVVKNALGRQSPRDSHGASWVACHDFSDKSDPADNASFQKHTMQMYLDGALGDTETVRDFSVAAALKQDRNDLLLAFGEPLHFQFAPDMNRGCHCYLRCR